MHLQGSQPGAGNMGGFGVRGTAAKGSPTAHPVMRAHMHTAVPYLRANNVAGPEAVVHDDLVHLRGAHVLLPGKHGLRTVRTHERSAWLHACSA